MLHDAGMSLAAYPGGLTDIKNSRVWPSLMRRFAHDVKNPSPEEIKLATSEFVRMEHANRAEELPKVEWLSPDGIRRRLIENGDIRQKFGQFIGEVAASHWWSHEKLATKLNRVVPPPPPYPTSWSIDLLKIAAILRVADAAQIDERRAPGFLWAIRASSFGKESAEHWMFQNRLTQPKRRHDALYYSSTSDFQKSESEAWWRAYDTLRYVDDELRRTDVLLADLRDENYRFAVKRVANVETATTLMQSVRISGWVPIDASIRIADVPKLIGSLGGEALYGKNRLAPLRELVQNASDAMKLRSIVQPERMRLGRIVLSLGEQDGKNFLEVEDEGVGMTADIIQNVLLDFGDSGWMKDPIFSDYPTKSIDQLDLIGKFGIGFFSVFMLSDRVDLITRRFDRSFDETLLLSFGRGLAQRPILSAATQDEWLMEGGTKTRVWLDSGFASLLTRYSDHTPDTAVNALERLFPALDFPIIVRGIGNDVIIDGTKWRDEDATTLLKRTIGTSKLSDMTLKLAANLRPIKGSDGRIVGRMCLSPLLRGDRRNEGSYGVVCVKGVAVTRTTGLLGIVDGKIVRASRDVASPNFTKVALAEWLKDQTPLLKGLGLPDELEIEAASVARSLGGDTGPLKICYAADGCLSTAELADFVRQRTSITVISEIGLPKADDGGHQTLPPDFIAIDGSVPGIFHFPRDFNHFGIAGVGIENFASLSCCSPSKTGHVLLD